jgi:hypothetical protein
VVFNVDHRFCDCASQPYGTSRGAARLGTAAMVHARLARHGADRDLHAIWCANVFQRKSGTQRTWLGVPICCIWLVPDCPIVTVVGLLENASRYMAMGNPSKNGLLSMWMFGLSSCIVSRGPGGGPVSGRPLAAIIVHCHLGLPASESQCWAQLIDLFDCRQRAPIQAQNLVTCSFYKILETPDSPLFRLCHPHPSSLSVT